MGISGKQKQNCRDLIFHRVNFRIGSLGLFFSLDMFYSWYWLFALPFQLVFIIQTQHEIAVTLQWVEDIKGKGKIPETESIYYARLKIPFLLLPGILHGYS